MAVLLVFVISIGCSTPFAFGGSDRGESSSLKKVGLSLKLSGGAGYLGDGLGDLNTYRLGRNAWAERLDQEPGYSSGLDWERPWFVPDLRADVIINVGRHFGFGFGTGFVQGRSQGVHSVDYVGQGNDWWSGEPYDETDRTTANTTFELTSVPVTLDLYFFQPLKSSGTISLLAHAGVGYYFGKLKMSIDGHDETQVEYYGSVYANERESSLRQNAKDQAWGFQGGLGLEFEISRGISFCSEFFARHVDFKDWRGDIGYTSRSSSKAGDESGWWEEENSEETASWKGPMWTYYIHDGYYDMNNTYIFIFPEKPEDSDFRQVRKSAFNLNAFGIALSLKFHFDLF
jgi:hypothetical protein